MDAILMRLSRFNRRFPAKVLVGLLAISLLVTAFHPMVATNAETEASVEREVELVTLDGFGSAEDPEKETANVVNDEDVVSDDLVFTGDAKVDDAAVNTSDDAKILFTKEAPGAEINRDTETVATAEDTAPYETADIVDNPAEVVEGISDDPVTDDRYPAKDEWPSPVYEVNDDREYATGGAAVVTNDPEDAVDAVDVAELEATDELLVAPPEQLGITVTLMLDGAIYETIKLAAAGYCPEPLPPAQDQYPAGMHSFLGWFTDEFVNDTDISFDFRNTLVSADLTLYACFTNKHLVKFLDSAGVVTASVLVTHYGYLEQSFADQVKATLKPVGSNTSFKYWYEDNPALEVSFPLMVSKPITLTPYFAQEYFLFFLSEGSGVNMHTYAVGQNTVAPAVPTRVGYDFERWVDYDTRLPFNFGTPLTKDTILQATWKAALAEYAVVYWLEKPDLGRDAVPGSFADYAYAYTEYGTGVPGTMTDVAVMSANAKGSSLAMTHSTVQSVANATIKGNGTGVVNVFCTRNLFEIQFDISYGLFNTEMEFLDITYKNSDERYTIYVKYEQPIRDIWPCHATAKFKNNNRLVEFSGWRHNGAAASNLHSWTTLREEFTADMLPQNSNATGYILFTDWRGPLFKKTVNYWLEALPYQIGTPEAKLVDDTWYVVNPKHSLTYSSAGQMVAPKDILGTTVVEEISTFDTSVSPSVFDFYYLRNWYTLSFNTMSGSEISPIRVMFEDRLADIKVAPPVRAEDGFVFTFMGWYTDAAYGQIVDFEKTTMPASDLELFAKWESTPYTVSYYSSIGEAEPFHSDGAGPSDYIQPPIDPGENVPGSGVLKNWLWRVGNRYMVYDPEMPISADLQLYPDWRTDGLTVTYDRGKGTTGSVPTDTDLYRLGVLAPVLSGQGLTIDNQALFAGWQVRGEGPAYYPGSAVKVDGNMELVARYLDPADVIKVTFHGNYPGGGSYTSYHSRSDVEVLLLNEGQARANGMNRTDHNLLGWSLTSVLAAGNEFFAPGEAVSFEQLRLSPSQTGIDLYAQWQSKTVVNTVTYLPGTGTWLESYTGPRPFVAYVEQGRSHTIVSPPMAGVNRPWWGFDHWNDGNERYYPGQEIIVTVDLVLTAQWFTEG